MHSPINFAYILILPSSFTFWSCIWKSYLNIQSMRQIQKSRLKEGFSFFALGSLRVHFEAHSQWWAILEYGFVSMACLFWHFATCVVSLTIALSRGNAMVYCVFSQTTCFAMVHTQQASNLTILETFFSGAGVGQGFHSRPMTPFGITQPYEHVTRPL